MNNNLRVVLTAVFVCLFLTGCQAMMYGTAEKLNKISVGMSKQQVIQELGNPDTTSASGSEEILKYKWMKTVVSWGPKYFYVRLADGKVQSYGEEEELTSKR